MTEAVNFINGDRRLDFQDASGATRESMYTVSTRMWSANVNNIITTDARNDTPIAAINMTLPSIYGTGQERTAWYNDSTNISGFTTAAGSGSLIAALSSIDPLPSLESSMFLVFGSISGNATALTITSADLLSRNGKWLNSSQVISRVVPRPITAVTGAIQALSMMTVNIVCLSQKTDYPFYVKGNNSIGSSNYHQNRNGSWRWGTGFLAADGPDSPNPFYSGKLEPGAFGLTQAYPSNSSSSFLSGWLSPSTQPPFDRQSDLPSWPATPPPYARLASTTVGNSSEFQLYYQLNDTAFAEETYNTAGGFGATNIFSISVSYSNRPLNRGAKSFWNPVDRR
ncbi:hypothetical protein MMC30_003507 [Trapelia coarctata]|nr:hypothetical protein [Trapelia coarctata]